MVERLGLTGSTLVLPPVFLRAIQSFEQEYPWARGYIQEVYFPCEAFALILVRNDETDQVAIGTWEQVNDGLGMAANCFSNDIIAGVDTVFEDLTVMTNRPAPTWW